LKGSTSHFAAPKALEAARALERAARDGDAAAAAAACLRTRDELSRLRRTLAALQRRLRSTTRRRRDPPIGSRGRSRP
jgi:hypothetical protein